MGKKPKEIDKDIWKDIAQKSESEKKNHEDKT
jgi:hypothetical protein